MDPDFARAHAALAAVYGTLGAWEFEALPPAEALATAKAAATRALERDPRLAAAVGCSSSNPVMLAGLGHALAAVEDRREALKVAEDLERLRCDKGLVAYELGIIRAALGEHDQAFRWFKRAVEERSGWIAYLRVDPRLDALQADARFDSLISDARGHQLDYQNMERQETHNNHTSMAESSV